MTNGVRDEIVYVRNRLKELSGGEDFRAFQARLMPTLDSEAIIGVRTPALRKLAAELATTEYANVFLDTLPHFYFDENNLHSFIISREKNFRVCVARVSEFLPYIDNWATCDQLSPKTFAKHRAELLPYIYGWLASDKTYTVRFAIGMLMQHYLDEGFSPEYADAVAAVRSEEYYVNMMRAWYFATALAKQYDAVMPYITEARLDTWTHNKTIQKGIESYRIPEAVKQKLREYRR